MALVWLSFIVGLLSSVILILAYMGFCLFGYWLNSGYDTKTEKYHPRRFGVGVLGVIVIACILGAITSFGFFILDTFKILP